MLLISFAHHSDKGPILWYSIGAAWNSHFEIQFIRPFTKILNVFLISIANLRENIIFI